MITFKQKQYVIPEEERFVKPVPFRIPNEWSIYGVKIDVKESGSYEKEVKQRKDSIWKEWKKILKELEKKFRMDIFIKTDIQILLIHIIILPKVNLEKDIIPLNQ